MVVEFDWDLTKELANISTHRCSFAEAVEAFRDPLGLMLADTSHSHAEPNGESSGGYTLKQPKMSDLKVDKGGTKALRAKMAGAKKIKITINLDADILSLMKELAEKSGVPYQKLLNKTLREHFAAKAEDESRLDALEREVQALKRKVSA